MKTSSEEDRDIFNKFKARVIKHFGECVYLRERERDNERKMRIEMKGELINKDIIKDNGEGGGRIR